ncbi:uncharacterized protein LOC135369001 isoform X2 [Ornithodoros turicata]|uniref:uncharacterized protein LOC135369001 isoform X2 n=1 Tax=Ornithodoros turicata TaxID=34597 RepID=UPI0031395992
MDYYQEVPQQLYEGGTEMSGFYAEPAPPLESSVSVSALKTEDESSSKKSVLIFLAICLLLFLGLLIGIVFYVTTTSKGGGSDGTPRTQEYDTYGYNPSASHTPRAQYHSSSSTTTTTYKPQIPSAPVQQELPPLLCETSIGNALTVDELSPHCDFFIVDFDFTAATHPQYNYILKVELEDGDKMEQFMKKKAGLPSKVAVGLPYNSVRRLKLNDDAGRTTLARGISQLLLDAKLDGVMLYYDELSEADASKTQSMLQSLTTEYNAGYYTLFKFKFSNIAASPKIQKFVWMASRMNGVFLVIETLSKIMPNPLLPNAFCETREKNYSIIRTLEDIVATKKASGMGLVGIGLRLFLFECDGDIYEKTTIKECKPTPYDWNATRKLCNLGGQEAEAIGWSMGTSMYTPAVNNKWKNVHFFENDYTLATKGEKILSYLVDGDVYSFIVLSGFENDLMDNYADCSRSKFAYTSALQAKVGPIARRVHQG